MNFAHKLLGGNQDDTQRSTPSRDIEDVLKDRRIISATASGSVLVQLVDKDQHLLGKIAELVDRCFGVHRVHLLNDLTEDQGSLFICQLGDVHNGRLTALYLPDFLSEIDCSARGPLIDEDT